MNIIFLLELVSEALAVSRLFYWGSFSKPVDGSYSIAAVTKKDFNERLQYIQDILDDFTTNKPK